MFDELRLTQFRSYGNDSFEFNSGVNIIVGPNAAGKTNLLEALLVLSRGDSYRVRDSELVQFSKPWARLEARLHGGSKRSLKLAVEPMASKVYEVDGKSYKRLSHLRSLPVVLFEPDHLRLLSGGPDNRRTYIDELLQQVESGYGGIRRNYQRTLAQRNALLKHTDVVNHTQLFPWNLRLSQLAGQVVRSRVRLAESIQAALPELYKSLSRSHTQLSVAYEALWPAESYETQFLNQLEAYAEIDRQRGFTSHGPHREDLSIQFDGRPAQLSASRGEIRTATLALKIIELQLLEVAREMTPLLLLDDVFSELDGKRRHALTDYMTRYQTFITTTDADLVIKNFAKNTHVIPVQPQPQGGSL